MQVEDPQGGDVDRGAYVGVSVSDLGVILEVLAPEQETPGQRRHFTSRFAAPPSPDALVEGICALIAQAGAPSFAGVGLTVWAGVDAIHGTIQDARYSAEWKEYPLTARLAERLGAPVRLTSGVNAAARAEADTLPGCSPLLYVHIGRTVASSLVVDGRPVLGAHGTEGRLAHWQTGLDGPRCVCGIEGHLGPLVAAQSLIRLAIGVASHDDVALAEIHRVTSGRAEMLTAPQFIALAKNGVVPLQELALYAAEALSSALANLIVTLDPERIVIGGAFAQVDEVYFDWLRERVDRRVGGLATRVKIQPARAGVRAALLGAMSLAAD